MENPQYRFQIIHTKFPTALVLVYNVPLSGTNTFTYLSILCMVFFLTKIFNHFLKLTFPSQGSLKMSLIHHNGHYLMFIKRFIVFS